MVGGQEAAGSFERLVDEAARRDFSGWDFSYLVGRWREGEPSSWDYRRSVLPHVRSAGSLLDLGTGGGEFLASLGPLPLVTWAAESHPPNVPLARARLGPLGVRVAAVERGGLLLPLADGTFDAVICRHAAFRAAEVARVLRPGGRFLTQQVGERNNRELNQWLQEGRRDGAEEAEALSSRRKAVRYLEEAGLEVTAEREERPATEFYDVGAVVYYLRAVPWQLEGFTPEAYYDRLRAMHEHIQREGRLAATAHRYYLEARKPP